MMLILAYDAYFFKKDSSDACQKGPKRLSGTKHHDAYKIKMSVQRKKVTPIYNSVENLY